MGRFAAIILAIAAAALVAIWAFQPGMALRVATGLAAKSVCSATFVSGLDGEQSFAETVKPMLSIAGPLVHVAIDPAQSLVSASILGMFAQRAQHSPGYGCRLVYEDTDAPVPLPPAPVASEGAAFETTNPNLRAAMDALFAEPPGETPRLIKAVVVVKDGQIIAERYAPGYGPDTPLPSFSIAKSVTNALLGILAQDGKIDIDAPAPILAWQKLGGFAATVTPHHLLQMASGTDMGEDGSGFDASSRMVYAQADMAAFAIRGRISEAPGTRWNYTSTNTVILASIMRRILGGAEADYVRFAHARLFQPLGMRRMTLEFDSAGTQEASASILGTARDWARFGQLFLNDGAAPGGERILPQGWVAMSRTSTLGTTYGAGFWTNDGPSVQAANRVAQGMPKDAFFASGNLGQRIYILPSAKTVIVRMGVTHRPPDFAIQGDLAFMRAVLAEPGSPGTRF